MTTLNEQCQRLSDGAVRVDVVRGIGRITLARPRALNALSLGMVRALTEALRAWAVDDAVRAVVIRGSGKDPAEPHFGHFCAGGDIRFFHEAALAGDPRLEDFFTEEYRLNHLIHGYAKPYIALMDGVVMGGGMGISQGAALRVVTPRSRMAMPETQIGLFPDVGGGWFLSRLAGRNGEYLALVGHTLGAARAQALGLADAVVDAAALGPWWASLERAEGPAPEALVDSLRALALTLPADDVWPQADIDAVFGLPDVPAMLAALEAMAAHGQGGDAARADWARHTAQALRGHCPLMLAVTLEQVRRGRGMTLAEDLRMERDLVRHCFHPRHLGWTPAQSQTVEGIRALAVDKDHSPRWTPARVEEVTADMVAGFFDSPWPASAHPLAALD